MVDFSPQKPCRILSLDGGGAKEFYTLGVLREIEGMMRCPLQEKFHLISGTSTGVIIAALLALGRSVKEISDLYEKHVPTVTQVKSRQEKSPALAKLGDEIFKEDTFLKIKTGVGIVATRWVIERPMIFKTSIERAHGRMGTFSPGFGVKVSDAVQVSCSAFPFFERKMVKTDPDDLIELIDGRYCANNLGTYGRWTFAEFTEVYQIEADFEAKVQAELNQMIERTAHEHCACSCTDRYLRSTCSAG